MCEHAKMSQLLRDVTFVQGPVATTCIHKKDLSNLSGIFISVREKKTRLKKHANNGGKN